MDKKEKSESDTSKRKHFSKLHERIQNKYNAMKLKLDKSKSIDSLPSLKDEFVYNNGLRASSNSKSITDSSEDVRFCKVEIEEIQLPKMDATSKEIYLDEASIFESADVFELKTNENNIEENYFFNDNFRLSLVSLNDSELNILERYECQDSPTISLSPKISIRNRIGSRLSAAKERRRIEKETNKENKKMSRERVDKYLFSNSTKYDSIKKERKVKIATVTIALVDAIISDSEPLTGEKLHCRIRLGNEKWKSKSIKSTSSKVSWQELCNFNMYDDPVLDISLWDKDFFLGRATLDITEVENERTHKMKLNLVDGAAPAQVFILLTISGTTSNIILEEDYDQAKEKLGAVPRKITWFRDLSEVGWLTVIVFGAKGLSANESYCVLELNNERLHTHTTYKTQDPNWMKIFNFEVTDVTSILKFTIYDEKRSEEIAKLAIPLLKIGNGNRKWYALKDVELRDRAKGNNPRILLEMTLSWNLVKASVRVIKPKEEIYLQTVPELDRKLLTRNWIRAKTIMNWVSYALLVFKKSFEWESRKHNTIALSIWLLFCYFFKIWMLPLLLMIPFVWYQPSQHFLVSWKEKLMKSENVSEEQDEKEEKTSLRKKINNIQEYLQTIQNYIGTFACFGERVKNLFNFTEPFLSNFAILIIITTSIFMYLIPTNYIFMFWGIQKYMKNVLLPDRVPNNEILDLLSRVPDDYILLDCEELPVDQMEEGDDLSKSEVENPNKK